MITHQSIINYVNDMHTIVKFNTKKAVHMVGLPHASLAYL